MAMTIVPRLIRGWLFTTNAPKAKLALGAPWMQFFTLKGIRRATFLESFR